MKISILTLFPDMFQGPFATSIIKRAQEKNLVAIEYINIREFGIGKHQLVDDTPYGGGIGMVMRVDVVHAAIEHAKKAFAQTNTPFKQAIYLLSARGSKFEQQTAKAFSQLDHLILICGHYEGIDDRIRHFIDGEISIGDFVLTGGEIPAMLVVDATVRLIAGVITPGATDRESYSLTYNDSQLLEYPHYTKPAVYEGHSIPPVLLSGNHKEIDAWRQEQAIRHTRVIRPDLLKK